MGGQAELSSLPISERYLFCYIKQSNSRHGMKMKWPIGPIAKIWWFPYKTYSRTSAYRFYAFTCGVVTLPLYLWIGHKMQTPANVEKLKLYQESKKVDKFRRPTLNDRLPGEATPSLYDAVAKHGGTKEDVKELVKTMDNHIPGLEKYEK